MWIVGKVKGKKLAAAENSEWESHWLPLRCPFQSERGWPAPTEPRLLLVFTFYPQPPARGTKASVNICTSYEKPSAWLSPFFPGFHIYLSENKYKYKIKTCCRICVISSWSIHFLFEGKYSLLKVFFSPKMRKFFSPPSIIDMCLWDKLKKRVRVTWKLDSCIYLIFKLCKFHSKCPTMHVYRNIQNFICIIIHMQFCKLVFFLT